MTEVLEINDLNIETIAVDSKTVTPGALFVALKGQAHDGHHYVEDAIENGASAILCEQSFSAATVQEHDIPFIRVPDTRVALHHLIPEFFNHPADGLELIGITGTNGKTSTAYLIDCMLQHAGHASALLSTITTRFGTLEKTPRNTTPGFFELQALFSEMREQKIQKVVMEVSSHALVQDRVEGLDFKSAVFTHLTQDHLDYHGNMQNYFEAKTRLFKQCTGRALINTHCPWGLKLYERLGHKKAWSFGLSDTQDIHAGKVHFTATQTQFEATTPIGLISIKSPLIGDYNVYNLLAAIGVGITLGLSQHDISEGLSTLKTIPGRLEKIDCGQDFTVLVDYAHTPDALASLLHTLKRLPHQALHLVFGCGGDRDRGKRAFMGRIAAKSGAKITLTSDNPRTESPQEILEEIELGIQEFETECGQKIPYHLIENRQTAIETVMSAAKKNDIVALVGKGHETYQEIGTIRHNFDDRVQARQALHTLGYQN